ncbi:MAG: type II toxin-antitoxin system HicA family toxin [Gammaproteobacteria bacterium]|nr:type II toxin-antitoxin system HicA family toxin [Gammaproteobacteria bacterium]
MRYRIKPQRCGRHTIYTHPARGGHLSVPHPKKDLGAGLVCKLRKQAGLI